MNDECERSVAAASASTVLLVDDQRAALSATAARLSGAGHRVLTATNATAALDLLVHERVDLLVIDQTILTSDGGELVNQVRAQDGGIPIIMLYSSVDRQGRGSHMRDLAQDGIHDRAGNAEQLLERVASALAGRRQGDHASAAQELGGLIVAKFCHDLLTSLHVIRGYTEILRNDPVTSSVDGILGRLELASDTALALAHDYLNLARLDAADAATRCDCVAVDALLEDLRVFARRQIGERPLRFTTDVPCSGTSIYTDGEKLRAILAQLLANAIKFSPAGEIGLVVQLHAERTDFLFTDSGPGIGPGDLPGMFRPFRQAADDTMASTPGQGVGLAIARRLSALIGASLTANRREPRGTTFTLSVPTAVNQPVDGRKPTLH